MGMGKDWKRLLAEAQQRGWTPHWTASGHVKLKRPGHRTLVMGSTPSDGRGLRNMKALIRREERRAHGDHRQTPQG
jgi:hypothetical protein